MDELFGDESGAYRRADPHTSLDAARITKAGILMGRIYRVLEARPQGLTSEEVSVILEIDLQSVTPRFSPMEAKGLIERRVIGSKKDGSFVFETRAGRSGRQRIIWYARGSQ